MQREQGTALLGGTDVFDVLLRNSMAAQTIGKLDNFLS